MPAAPAETSARTGWLGAAIVVAAAGMFGSLGVLSRFAYDAGMEPFAFVAWRAAIGGIGLWLAIVLIRRPSGIRAELAKLDPPGRRWLILAVAIAAALNFAAFLSFDTTTVALALLGFYTYPAMVAAASALLGREAIDPAKVIALVLALGGMAAVVVGSPAGDPTGRAAGLGIGLALALTAAALQTVFMLTSRGYAALAADHAMATILGGTAILAIPISLIVNGADALAFPLTAPPVLGLLVVVGLFAAALPSVMFLTGIRWIGGVRTGILMLFEPVVGVALAAILLAEPLAPVQVLGGATVLLAALIVQRGARRASEPSAVAPAPGGP